MNPRNILYDTQKKITINDNISFVKYYYFFFSKRSKCID